MRIHLNKTSRDALIAEYHPVRECRATTVRLLRLATNSFLSSVDLVMRTMAEFAPDPGQPGLSDEELEKQRRLANADGPKGIELRGDGKGAGSGEEVQSEIQVGHAQAES